MFPAYITQILFALAIVSNNHTAFIKCGGEERWDVKTLQDADANSVKKTPSKTSVETLTKKTRPAQVGQHTPRFAAEKKTYTVLAIVKEYFTEADGDIHIVLQDVNDPGITMIAEMPDYTCDKVTGSSYVSKFKQAKDNFKSYRKTELVGHKFFFTGVAFFDLTHGTAQRGVAPNGIELHPVLNFH
jgi:hypothetical protein